MKPDKTVLLSAAACATLLLWETAHGTKMYSRGASVGSEDVPASLCATLPDNLWRMVQC